MEDNVETRLANIETAELATTEALREQAGLLQVAIRHLAEIIDLLTPNESGNDGTPLDELLAHLIKQTSEQLRLAHDLVEAMNRLENELPAKIAALVSRANGDAGDYRG